MPTPLTTILGIDPGFDRCGWAVVTTAAKSRTAQLVQAHSIQTRRAETKIQRFNQIFTELSAIITQYQVNEIAMESLYFSRNVSTALPVSEIRGLIVGLGFSYHLKLAEYTPAQVKMAITGYGRADKKQMQHMLVQLLRLETIPKLDDTSDAIAVALTHVYSQRAPIASL